MTKPLLDVKDLKIHFPQRKGVIKKRTTYVKAVDGISFTLNEGETLGLVGESGCGKSTTGRGITRLVPVTDGEVRYEGTDIASLSKSELREHRKNMQMVFQDPYASLNPRLTVEDILAEPLKAHGVKGKAERRKQIEKMMDVVGLNRKFISRYAHEFSGGQRQRIGIARALILNPKLIIADEPVAALDVSIQAQILNLLKDLQEEFGLTYLFISHDLSVVRHLCNRVAVMYLGRMAEVGNTDKIFENPLHPYTQTLLSAIPVSNPRHEKERIILQGDVPSPVDPPKGCAFVGRCPKAHDRCHSDRPKLQKMGEDHYVACHLYD
ncbi:dipeptide/oligopeptide/nickel ABC transporter ATP-binding protein [Alteribacter lacisalsi]|uniref:Dipeptide/oligopeptide/nickel ABC transporter ATP-binding protein n=1 Tax=Alteribacter lacisalsi TaxID=2045244 RepID=A0A2W0HKJ5_9BACI|nr:dipeptide ABC transporter ATP-binding protein [Alteribacter lacisalsi]PYZ97379.1 dipeptide/oligopeptide/nickel ABC transporter ATP-binding protein [Alteribacter lacisalsi]